MTFSHIYIVAQFGTLVKGVPTLATHPRSLYNLCMQQTDIATIKAWLGTGAINIFGLPFSGKDTHGGRLAEIFNASIMGGGDILRNSVIPPHVRELIDAGKLAPIDDYISIVTPYLSRDEFAGRPLILSSVGRWHGEEPGVVGAAEAAGHPIKAVIYLSLSEATSHERFLKSLDEGDRERRTDDTEEVLATRYSEFHTKTMPVIDYYRERDLLIEVDGNPPKEEVTNMILQALLERAKRQ